MLFHFLYLAKRNGSPSAQVLVFKALPIELSQVAKCTNLPYYMSLFTIKKPHTTMVLKLAKKQS